MFNLIKNLLFSTILFLLFSCNSTIENTISSYDQQSISPTELDFFIHRQMDSLNIPAISIAIINDAKTVYHRAIGVNHLIKKEPINEHSIFEAASLSKPIFAFFILKLSEKGFIDLDRPLYFYLPDEKMERDQRYKEVSARSVLRHTSGFTNWRWFDSHPEGVEIDRGDFFMVSEPNTKFDYSGEAYQYLARVIAHLCFINMNELGDLFSKEISTPLEMEHAYFVWDDFLMEHKVYGHKGNKPQNRNGGGGLPSHNSLIFSAAGGLKTEAKNYAKFINTILLQKGLSKKTFKDMLSPQVELSKESSNYLENGITAWGAGFGIQPMESDTIYRHGGNNSDFQSEMAFSLNQKFGYVFFVNCDKGKEFNKRLEVFLGMQKK
ncbi:MAG: serine hydrolase domain-containing protein [Saprospiraceae bacterium]